MNARRSTIRTNGFTLVEMMLAIAIFSIVILMLLTLSLSMGSASRFQDAKIQTQDDARTGMMILVRDIRQAARTSINWAALPSNTISYRVAEDVDGNGVAVDVDNNLELGPLITVGVDNGDLNGDGETTSQLIWSDGNTNRVLVNGLVDTTEDLNGNNVLDAGEDVNGNGILDQGFWIRAVSNGLLITIQTQRPTDAAGTNVTSMFTEFVVPRN
jgi:prepilin-type N-terminal cleavage/methylation domain-containing protein